MSVCVCVRVYDIDVESARGNLMRGSGRHCGKLPGQGAVSETA